MSLGHANDFIRRGQRDAAFRKALNAAGSPDEARAVLELERLIFTPDEFDDALRRLLTLCQSEEQADQLREFALWWKMISATEQG